MSDRFQEGVEHFNRGRFFEAHETWEELWLGSQGEEKRFLQGLIQLAAAFHHFRRGNQAGAKSLASEALRKLQDFAPRRCGLDLKHLLEQMEPWRIFLESFHEKGAEESPLLPRMEKA